MEVYPDNQLIEDRDKVSIIVLTAKWCRECHEYITLLDDILKSDSEFRRECNFYIVDIDERPDFLERFNFGGLPSTVFISDDKILYGFSGSTSRDIIREIINDVLNGKTTVYDLSDISELEAEHERPTPMLVMRVMRILEERFDWMYGGFIGDFKIPPPRELKYLIEMYLEYGIDGYLRMVRRTVDMMFLNGNFIYSYGGFSRLSKDISWREPDEAILSDLNSEILLISQSLFKITREGIYENICNRLVDLITNKLYIEDLGFARGLYWIGLDDRLLTDVNMIIASNLIRAYMLGASKKCLDYGIKVVDLMIELGEISHHFNIRYNGNSDTSPTKELAFLNDYTACIEALLEAYMASGVKDYLDRSIDLVNEAEELFRDGWAYRDLKKNSKLFTSKVVRRPFHINSRMARVLIILYHLTGDDRYLTRARQVLGYYVTLFDRYGYRIGEYGEALLYLFKQPPIIEIRGLSKLKNKIRRVVLPNTIIKWLPECTNKEVLIYKEGKTIKFTI